MLAFLRPRAVAWAVLTASLFCLSGCTGPREYIQNGFKVGPNYCRPPAAVAPHWIDAADARLRPQTEDLSHWWTVLNDPILDRLVVCAYRQNLTLREAGYRILEARAQLGIVTGEFFPQQQSVTGSYRRSEASLAAGNGLGGFGGRMSNQWNLGFNLAWEVDFWGRFRRAILAAEDSLDASVAGYDQVLVTLLGDVAANYNQIRTYQTQIDIIRANVNLQRGVLGFIEKRFEAGFRVNELDVDQARSNLAQVEAQIPALQIQLRQAENRLCILLGQPPEDLWPRLGAGPIPTAPPDVVVGIPCDLLRRRPDVRQAERLAAAQAEQIGIAEADFYPAFTINGSMGFAASQFSQLFTSNAFNGSIGPSFQWNILNYGRIINNVRLQDARFKELVLAYQQSVLQANAEAENAMVAFLRSQQQSQLLNVSVDNAEKAVKIVVLQYEKGAVDFNRYATIAQNLVIQQNSAAQARGAITQGLIDTYRALGGGWEIRCQPNVPLPAGSPPADGAPVGTVPATGPKPPTVPNLPTPAGPMPEQLPSPPPNSPEPPGKLPTF